MKLCHIFFQLRLQLFWKLGHIPYCCHSCTLNMECKFRICSYRACFCASNWCIFLLAHLDYKNSWFLLALCVLAIFGLEYWLHFFPLSGNMVVVFRISLNTCSRVHPLLYHCLMSFAFGGLMIVTDRVNGRIASRSLSAPSWPG